MIINKKNFYIIIFFILIFLLFVFRFHGTSYKFDPNVCELPMKWKHSAATFEQIQSAIKDKYCGIEIDINLHPEGFFIAEYHDSLNIDAPKLLDLMKSFPSIQYWWLDFKNLKYDNADLASFALEELTNITSGKIIVESHNFWGLFFLNTNNNQIFKAYWLAKNSKRYLYFLYLARSIFAMIFINPDFVTMFEHQVDTNDYIWVGSRQRLAFTVNNIETLNNLYLNNIEVVLTDKLKP